MANYTTNPKLLLLYASITQQLFVDPYTGAPWRAHQFTNGDNCLGDLYVVDQITAPTAYNVWVLTAAGSKIALTDGLGIVYAQATGISYVATPFPKLNFTLLVSSAALDAALNAVPLVTNISAYLECRIVLAGSPSQTEVICSDQVQIFKTALFP